MLNYFKIDNDSKMQLQRLEEFLMESPVFPGRQLSKINPFNECTIDLMIAVEQNFGLSERKEILVHHLERLCQRDFLPEDRERIYDTFFKLSLIARVKISRELDQFQYTQLVRFAMRLFNFSWQSRGVFKLWP